MSVSLDEHRLGALRWIVLRGLGREAFRALGEHMRHEITELTAAWPLLPRLRAHASRPPGRARLASVRRPSDQRFPDPGAELVPPAEGTAMPLENRARLTFRAAL